MVRNPGPGVTRAAAAAGRVAAILAGTATGWLRKPLPAPPARLRSGPLRRGTFSSRLRSPQLTSQLGIALAAAFTTCFVTGLLSHLIQHPPAWFWWPPRPVHAYRISQGLHVATGLACIPLLGAKLWSVYPRLFGWPPARTLAHGIERAGVAVLVAAALFQVVGGTLNISRWYALMPFFFTAAHHWSAWLAIGALLIHIGVKLPIIRAALVHRRAKRTTVAVAQHPEPSLTRRGVLGAVGTAAGVITVATIGQTIAPLSGISLLAPRRPTAGPQGLPVNKTAAGAGVTRRALDPAYRLILAGPGSEVTLSLADLDALAQRTVSLPIACVEGWSATGTWTGIRLRDLVALVDVDPDAAEVDVESLQTHGRYRATTVPRPHTRDPFTMLALRLNGEPLHLDHGYPARLIAPNRPGVLQTKWVARIVARAAS